MVLYVNFNFEKNYILSNEVNTNRNPHSTNLSIYISGLFNVRHMDLQV